MAALLPSNSRISAGQVLRALEAGTPSFLEMFRTIAPGPERFLFVVRALGTCGLPSLSDTSNSVLFWVGKRLQDVWDALPGQRAADPPGCFWLTRWHLEYLDEAGFYCMLIVQLIEAGWPCRGDQDINGPAFLQEVYLRTFPQATITAGL